MQSENGVEMSKVSIRGSGIESDDEPLGVEFLLDGISFDQGDGETIIEDFDVSTLKYAEVYRGADCFQIRFALTMGGAINLVPFTGYDADRRISSRLEGGSYGFVRGEASAAGVDGPFDYYASASGRYRDGLSRAQPGGHGAFVRRHFGDKISDNLGEPFLPDRWTGRESPTARRIDAGTAMAAMIRSMADPNAAPLDYSKQWYYVRLADKISYANNGHELDASSVYWWHRELLEEGFYDRRAIMNKASRFTMRTTAGISLNSVTRSLNFSGSRTFSQWV
jgi:iron complex outermembrane receptor protein